MSPDEHGPVAPRGRSGARAPSRSVWSPASFRDDEEGGEEPDDRSRTHAVNDPQQAPGRAPTEGRSRLSRAFRTPSRGRRVRRTVRHVEPWSVLKIALLFHAALFLIVCVASALLWSAARASGTLDNVESFITSVGGFGNCEPIDGAPPVPTTTPTTVPAGGAVDQLDPSDGSSTSVPVSVAEEDVDDLGDEEDCRAGERLVGDFEFEDGRIFQAFAFGGVVLVLAGAGASVVLVLLFNLMSDLTGGVQVTVLEDEPRTRRPPADASSPPSHRRG
ncbi:MAG: DUF3566 domain-containing protein [Acidimicrobiales bacterium]|nr:DUF3566 domain-containing protein [Acidimicrobiales bacterium]